MVNQETSLMKHKFLAPRAKSFKTRLKDKQIVQFQNGVFQTDDDELATALTDAIETNPALALHIRSANMAEAEAMVAKHQAALSQQVHTGALHSGALDDLKQGAIPASASAREESAPNNHEEMEKLQKAMASESNKASTSDTLIVAEDAGVAEIKAMTF